MEAVEFMRKRKRMCEYYGDDTCVCEDSHGACPALDIDCSLGKMDCTGSLICKQEPS